MGFTKPNLSKLLWLRRRREFQDHPLRTVVKVLLWECYRMIGRKVKATFDGDLSVYLYPNDGVGRLIFYFGYHEPEIFHFLDTFLQDGMVFFDIGANIGIYSLYASKRIGSGRVHCFEPFDETFSKLQVNISLNGINNAALNRVAVGDTVGRINLVVDEDSSKNFVTEVEDSASIFSPIISLNQYADSNSIEHIDYLKIDVEGYELKVIRGASNLIARQAISVIQLELYEDFQKRAGGSVKEVVDILTASGYNLFEQSCDSVFHPILKSHIDGDVFALSSLMIIQLTEKGLIE